MRRHPSRVAKIAVRVCGVVLTAALCAACGGGGGSASPPTAVPSAGHSSTTTTAPVHTTPTTPTTLPECGATRDPLDPTDSNAPNC
jgi:hypothetical protein